MRLTVRKANCVVTPIFACYFRLKCQKRLIKISTRILKDQKNIKTHDLNVLLGVDNFAESCSEI